MRTLAARGIPYSFSESRRALIPSRSPARRLTVTDDATAADVSARRTRSETGRVKKLLKFGAVSVNGTTMRQFDHPLASGDEVLVQQAQTAVANSRLERAKIHVVYEDEALIVLDKPVGLLTVATDDDNARHAAVSAERVFALARSGPSRAGVCRPSARPRDVGPGAVCQKRPDANGWCKRAGRRSKRFIMRWSSVRPIRTQGTITSYLTETTALHVFSNDHETPGGRLAVTRYRLLETRGWFSLLEVYFDTGRKHQIRVHLAEIRCRVTGDHRYRARHDPFGRLRAARQSHRRYRIR